MQREELYVADLVDNARAVREYLDEVTRERWDADRVLRDAVLYRMLLLGEIASALPDDLRDRYPDVAWRQIRAFRNLAVHRYFSVDWAVVWKIAQEEPPVLEEQALAIIRAEFPYLAQAYGQAAKPEPEPEPDHRGDDPDA
ncbi:MAG: HepT-like ribonuclease domain-containing protein [Streptosporangiaceae bacterium]